MKSEIVVMMGMVCAVSFEKWKAPLDNNRYTVLGLSISCSATFEELFRFGATFSLSGNFSDFVQPFLFFE